MKGQKRVLRILSRKKKIYMHSGPRFVQDFLAIIKKYNCLEQRFLNGGSLSSGGSKALPHSKWFTLNIDPMYHIYSSTKKSVVDL